MKNIRKFFPILLMIVTSMECASQTTKETYKQQITDYQNRLAAAASIFFNERLNEDQRIKAVAETGEFMSVEDITRAKTIVQNTKETELIRATALTKVQSDITKDTKFLDYVLGLVKSADTPRLLRNQAFMSFRILTFSTAGSNGLNDKATETMRQLTTDKNIAYREGALSWLVSRNDEYANRILLNAIKNNDQSVLPLAKSIQLLSFNMMSDAYPALHNILKTSQSDSVRIQAVKLLGGYQPAQQDLVQVVMSGKESEAIRLTAMGALSANKTENFSDLILPVVIDVSAPESLRVYAVRAEMYRRMNASRTEKRINKQGDKFDNAVQDLAKNGDTDALKKICQQYMFNLNPK